MFFCPSDQINLLKKQPSEIFRLLSLIKLGWIFNCPCVNWNSGKELQTVRGRKIRISYERDQFLGQTAHWLSMGVVPCLHIYKHLPSLNSLSKIRDNNYIIYIDSGDHEIQRAILEMLQLCVISRCAVIHSMYTSTCLSPHLQP